MEEINGWLFAMPWIIGFLLFTVLPMGFSLYTSFTRYNIIAAPRGSGWRTTPRYLKTPFLLKPSEYLLDGDRPHPGDHDPRHFDGLILIMDLPGDKGFRTIIYLPNVLSGMAAIFLWQFMLTPSGLFNRGLAIFGIDGPAWFADPLWTKPGMVVMGVWWVGGNALIYLASLKGIPNELYEAAAIDGAQGWTRTCAISPCRCFRQPSSLKWSPASLAPSRSSPPRSCSPAATPLWRSRPVDALLRAVSLQSRLWAGWSARFPDGLRLSHGLDVVHHYPGHHGLPVVAGQEVGLL